MSRTDNNEAGALIFINALQSQEEIGPDKFAAKLV
jgi:hypothetical protein